MTHRLSKASFIGAAFGTMIEYYDYALIALFFPIIAPVFFPGKTVLESIQNGYYVLLIAMIVRPFGGVFFGHIGDMIGRKRALVGSMYGIAIATVFMGLTPSYQQIGIWATVLLVVVKSIQVFCFGGEYNGAGVYVVEHAQSHNEGFIGSLLSAVTAFGSIVAAFIGMLVTMPFMPSWSWRIAFLLGGVIGVIGIRFRKNMLESPNFTRGDPDKHTLRNIFLKYPKQFMAGILIGGLATMELATIFTFINATLMAKNLITQHQVMTLQAILLTFGMVITVISGKLADMFGHIRMLKLGVILLAIAFIPVLSVVDTGNVTEIIIAQVAMILVCEFFFGATTAVMTNLFPKQYRYRATSISFCIGMSLIGGLTPLVESLLYQYSGYFSVASIWPIGICLLGYYFISAIDNPEPSHDMAMELSN